MTQVATFAQYGKNFQERLLQALLVDRQFAEQMSEVFKVEYFDQKYLKFLAEKYFNYVQKYKTYPTLQLLVTIIKDELKIGTDIILRDQIIDCLQRTRANTDLGDLPYVKDKSLDFCRKQALKQALEVAVDQMQAEKYEQIVDGIKKAVCVGTTPQLGHDFFADYEARFSKLQRSCIATGFPELDKKGIFDGGVGIGDLFCVIGSSGAGKCSAKDSYISIKYTGIKINGKTYRPWDRVNTKRGTIFARDIVESDVLL
jgi:replicative DNA helicase